MAVLSSEMVDNGMMSASSARRTTKLGPGHLFMWAGGSESTTATETSPARRSRSKSRAENTEPNRAGAYEFLRFRLRDPLSSNHHAGSL